MSNTDDGILAGAWAVDLGMKERHEIQQLLSKHGGTIALTPASRSCTFLLTTLDSILSSTNPELPQTASTSKVRVALSLGVIVITRDYLDDCLSNGKQLDSWKYRYFGSQKASELGPSLEAILAPIEQFAVFSTVKLASIVYGKHSIKPSFSNAINAISALLYGLSRDPPLPGELLADQVQKLYKPQIISSKFKAFPPPPSISKPSGRLTTKERMEAAKLERERVKKEEIARKKAEREAEKNESIAGKRNIDCNVLKQQREEQKEQRRLQALERAEQRASEARKRRAEKERIALIRRAEIEKMKKEQNKIRMQLREAFSKTRNDINRQIALKSDAAIELEEAAALAHEEVEEKERERNRQRQIQRAKEIRAAKIKRQERLKREDEERKQVRNEKLKVKDLKRIEYVETKKRVEEERKLLKKKEWEERQRKKAEKLRRKLEMEEKNKERKARGLKLLESLGPIHLRKVFVGGIKFNDILESKAVPECKKAAIKQRRINETRKLFSKFGKITQWQPCWEKGFIHIVYKTVNQATRCMQTLGSFDDRKELCDEACKEIEHEKVFDTKEENELAGPTPHFYVREPKNLKGGTLMGDPERSLILDEQKAQAKQKKAEEALAAAAKQAEASFRGRGRRGRGGGVRGRGGRGRGRGRGGNVSTTSGNEGFPPIL